MIIRDYRGFNGSGLVITELNGRPIVELPPDIKLDAIVADATKKPKPWLLYAGGAAALLFLL